MNHCAGAIVNNLLVICAAMGLWACAATNPPTAGKSEPVNYMEISDRLVTSGQPSATQIAALNSHQYQMVINLAPTDVDADFHDEAYLLGKKGITYIAIPVEMQQPKYRDFVLFSNILSSTEDGRVWVHCRINNRASMFTFLYRVIHEGADPYTAYDKVTAIWVPTARWLRFARETLAKHHISYDF